MTISDWLLICSTVMAPLLAVQVQKWLERNREKKDRKLQIFKTLMATRANTLSLEHVKALNMIDLEFYEEKHKQIRIQWRTYLDHLNNFPKDNNEALVKIWLDKNPDYLAKLLMEMGKALNYEFDEVHIKKGCYNPIAHNEVQNEQTQFRKKFLELLDGQRVLPVQVKDNNQQG